MFGFGSGLQQLLQGLGSGGSPAPNPFASAAGVPGAVPENQAPLSRPQAQPAPQPVAFTQQTPNSGAYQKQIAQIAQEEGFDPSVVLKVVRGEGGFSDPFQHGRGPAPKSQAKGLGPTENSYGPIQLYISGTGAGLGDRALAAGVDPRKDWQAGLRFGLREVAQKGWGQWYGAKAAGVTGKAGYRGAGGTPTPIGGAPIQMAKAAPRGNQPGQPPTAGDSGLDQTLAVAAAQMGPGGQAAPQPDTSLRARIAKAATQVQPAAPAYAEASQTQPKRQLPMPDLSGLATPQGHQFLRSVSPVAMVALAKRLNGMA